MRSYSKTRQRRLLLDVIQEAGGHIDARELLRRAMERDENISHATVYRSLSLFKQLGLIDEKRLGQARCYYEAKQSPEHQHLVCQRCGKVFDFACPLHEVAEKVKRENGFIVTKAEVYLEGYCSECGGMDQVKDIEEKIAELKARWPAHSVPPRMWQELEDLEDQLERAKAIKNSSDK